jgi:hypothetical protein
LGLVRSGYLFEFHYRDGRVSRKPSGEYAGSPVVEAGDVLLVLGSRWRVRRVVSEPSYVAKIVLDDSRQGHFAERRTVAQRG